MKNEEAMVVGDDLPLPGRIASGNRIDVLRHFAINNMIGTHFKFQLGQDGKELTVVLSRRGEEDDEQTKRELSVISSGAQDGQFDLVESMLFRPKVTPSSDVMGIFGGFPNLKTLSVGGLDFSISARAFAAFFANASRLQECRCKSRVEGSVQDFQLWADAISSNEGSSLRDVHFDEEGNVSDVEDKQKSVKWDAVVNALARRSLRVSSNRGYGMDNISFYPVLEHRMVLSSETSHLIARLEANDCAVRGAFDLSFDGMVYLVVHCREYAKRFIEHYRRTPSNTTKLLRGVHFHVTSELPESFISRHLSKNCFGLAQVGVDVASQYEQQGGVKNVKIHVKDPAFLEAPGEILFRLQDLYPQHLRSLVTTLKMPKEELYLCEALKKWDLHGFDPTKEATEIETWVRMLSVLANIPRTKRFVPGGDPFVQECSLSPLFDLLVQHPCIIGVQA